MKNETVTIETPTIMIFRKWRGRDGDVIAIMPFVVGSSDPNTCLTYEHFGQHGAGNDLHIVQQTTLATPEEYAPLKEELEEIGYVIETRRKISPAAYKSRQAQIQAID